MKTEAAARIRINKLLERAGWRLLDSGARRANVQLEPGVDIAQVGDDFEHTSTGFIDYLLLGDDHFPVCVLEAKREKIHPLTAKEQARDYAKGKNTRFVILSNGISHYLWDIDGGNPELITELPTLEALKHRSTYRPNIRDFIAERVGAEYLSSKFLLRDYQSPLFTRSREPRKKARRGTCLRWRPAQERPQPRRLYVSCS